MDAIGTARFTGDKSNINDVVEFLNKGLSEGFKVEELRKVLGLGEKALQGFLKDNRYKYNQKLKAYIKITEDAEFKNTVANTEVIQSNYKEDTSSNSNQEILDALTTVKELKEMQNQFKEMYEWYRMQTDTSIIDVTPQEFRIIKNDNDTISRNLRIYTDTNKRFKGFCEKHSESKIQDILNTAIVEFLDKYR